MVKKEKDARGREEQIVEEKLRKLKEMRKNNIEPYPHTFDKKHSSQYIHEKYSYLKKQEQCKCNLQIAGRIISIRDIGKIIFINLRDNKGDIQIVLQENETPKNKVDFFKNYIDAGDFIGVKGNAFRTKRGELSVLGKDILLLSKSIKPLPSKWHGLQDKEERYRKRYLDLIMNPDVKNVFHKRDQILNTIIEN